ncbi:sel1 repeat family protein [Pyxidicoccus parkwayensis]|uniref:Sel1 repeat family protein n=1 Tax=Pyxidicoccus parkwayensis TaxID=2813578 RepID=A0ABX7P8A9_9BACT|nr:sel1 repeat family protein [Pyxidicoccus parkwaysis]
MPRRFSRPPATPAARACSALASLYEIGQGVELDKARAASLYQRACDQDWARACTNLGWMRSFDSGAGKADGEQALQLFVRACEAGDVLACRREAQAWQCARGVPVADMLQAMVRYRAACKKGDAASCEWLASRHSGEESILDQNGAVKNLEHVELQAAIEAARFGRKGRAEELLRRVEGSAPELKRKVAFVRACLALDAGELERARELMSGLPDAPAVRVLGRLVEARKAGVKSWTPAMTRAWVAEGRPDLRGSFFLPSTRELEHDWGNCGTPRERRSPSPEMDAVNGFLQEYSDTLAPLATAPVSDGMLAQAITRVEDARLAVRLAALEVLTRPALTEAQRKKAWPIAERHLARLAEEHPDNLFFKLWATLGPTKEGPPLTEQLVDRLEAMVALRFQPPLREVYDAFRTVQDQAGEDRAPAFSASISVLLGPRYTEAAKTWEEQAKTAEPELRQRLGRALVALGKRISEGGWMVHVFQGASVTKRGAAMIGSEQDAKAASELMARGRRFYGGVDTLGAMGSWPLSAFTAEWLDRVSTEELTFYTELAEAGAW